ncbi:NACHT, LRR and PYD domains-containing protein 1 homolog [Engraulis encrasicolus]|uniref:NACHT, LRR and PYD domains-containing protein 1 homolog n=1 Tax=Engraulis encrasicolus TaxID=184585 RepID=UPI002FD01DB3
MCSHYEALQEYNSLPGEEVLLTDRYTPLLIIEKHRDQEEREKEICRSGPGFIGARIEEYKSTTVDQFFRPKDNGRIPRAVILQGNSGHGKSLTAQKIILDWASGSLYQNQFALVLHLSCKELNLIYSKGVQKSVAGLVSLSQKFTPLVLKTLKDLPQKVLLLLDGFDELQFPVCEVSNSPVKDLSTPAPVEVILGALLKGSILSECHLLVTTRPSASGELNKLLKRPVRCTEVLGFTEEGVHEYIKRFCKDDEVWKNVSSRVMSNETLFTSCFIPVICWIVCTVFRNHLQKNVEMTNSLQTTTSIFVNFVSILLKHHCWGLKQPVAALLKSLGQLAETGRQKQQVLFSKGVVFNTVSDPTSVPFLCKFLVKETVDMVEMFSFMHLSFQEFFSALHYILSQDEEMIKELLASTRHPKDRIHRLPVIQFLFGLSNVKVMQVLQKHGLNPNPQSKEQLKEWVLYHINKNSQKKHVMRFILHCLYELHEEEFVKSTMAIWGKVSFVSISLTRTDCWVLLYCLQCCPTIPSLELKRCNITADKMRLLQPALSRCQELGLQHSSLSYESMQQILIALSRQKSVGRVWVCVKTITPNTVQTLLRFMKSSQTADVGFFAAIVDETLKLESVLVLEEAVDLLVEQLAQDRIVRIGGGYPHPRTFDTKLQKDYVVQVIVNAPVTTTTTTDTPHTPHTTPPMCTTAIYRPKRTAAILNLRSPEVS